jgi:hypothetical protein
VKKEFISRARRAYSLFLYNIRNRRVKKRPPPEIVAAWEEVCNILIP